MLEKSIRIIAFFIFHSMAGEDLVEVMVVVGKMGLLLESPAQKVFMVSSVG